MIEVVNPGIYTTIQDRGRFGYRDQGVPLSGAMDFYTARLANQLVGNREESAVMEFTFKGPTLKITKAMNIAITGRLWELELNNEPIEMNKAIHLPAGSILKIKGAQNGMYAYLAVQGGFDVPKVLDSYSYYPHISKKSKLQRGDILYLMEVPESRIVQTASVAPQNAIFATNELEVEVGPEFEKLSNEMQKMIFQTDFSPDKDSNRMAFPLTYQGHFTADEITTASVQPGTIQLTPSGKLLVLMRDAQTTGGYARVLQLCPMAINQLAQKKPGDQFRLRLKS